MILPAKQSASSPALGVGPSPGDWGSGEALAREATSVGAVGNIAGMPTLAGARPAEPDGLANQDGAPWYGNHDNQAVCAAIKALDGVSDIAAIMDAWISVSSVASPASWSRAAEAEQTQLSPGSGRTPPLDRASQTGSSGHEIGPNTYAELENYPLERTDPTGLMREQVDPNPDRGYLSPAASGPVRPGSDQVERYGRSAQNLPIIDGPFGALSHYIGGSGTPVQYPFSHIDTSDVKVSQFPAAAKLIADRVPGRFDIDANLGYSTSGFESAAFVGRIVLNVHGSLVVNENGSHSFKGTLGARPIGINSIRQHHAPRWGKPQHVSVS